ncbi:MAG TPA: HAD-IC family P-type ATPase [Gemmatimonadales bacterium]|nr:HAD-IC family P-type ATPase [Gemmatimonadales bacterium]
MEGIGTTVATAWHALAPEEVCRLVATTPAGLTTVEAAARLTRFGPNEISPPPPVSAWRILADQFRSIIVVLLLVAAGVALVGGHHLDAAAIGAVLVLNAALGFFVELPTRRALEALRTLQVPRATVIRDGHAQDIDARALVPGDVIALEAGQAVPADARLLSAFELRVVEAPLTGESLPVEKDASAAVAAAAPLPDRRTLLYQGTAVVAGTARAVVVATGAATAVGRIGTLASQGAPPRTPLERRLDALGRRLAVAALAVALVVALLGFLQGIPLASVLAVGLALAVAAVPEGLPAVVTVTMAVGVRRMARRHALVRRLPAIESLGSATVVCTDKTGTLTTGEMTATTLWLGGREIAITGVGYAPVGGFLEGATTVDPSRDQQLARSLRVAALANRAGLIERDGQWRERGDPTEVALLVAARKGGLDRSTLIARQPEVGELPFSSDRMFMATFHEDEGGGLAAAVKGAPDRVLERCDRYWTAQGELALGAETRASVLRENESLAARGLRVLALALGPVESTTDTETCNLGFVGLIGLADPPAPGVLETIRTLREAGIRTVMLTGDQRRTAEAVAHELGGLSATEQVMDARELLAVSDTDLAARVRTVGAFCRVSPEDKLRIVRALQHDGQIVAMLGDGVNDAPALRHADIGVAMGRRGSDVAREAAALVLQDDRFPTVASAVEEGRVVFDNIRKFVFYLFSCNLAEVAVFLGAALAGWPVPLTPLQILWLNLVTDGTTALPLAVEPAEPDLMRRPPREPRSAILSPPLVRAAIAYALLIAVVTLVAFAWSRARTPEDPARAVTVAFLTLGLAQVFHLGNARSTGPVVASRRALSNRHAIGAVVLAGLLQWLAVSWAPLAHVLGARPITPLEWAMVAGLAVVPGVVGQIVKVAREPNTRFMRVSGRSG